MSVPATNVTGVTDDVDTSLPSQIFLSAIRKTWTHVPNTPDEAIALYRYTMKSQIEPAIAALLKECGANLTEPEQAHVAANVKEVVPPVVKKGCW
jgi:hypothetical protein|uniref:Uncharacterized protein n=1 Tax=viral metagenome TaxID=1070528 RepID=A0A6C0LPZ9_9ZZZZ